MIPAVLFCFVTTLPCFLSLANFLGVLYDISHGKKLLHICIGMKQREETGKKGNVAWILQKRKFQVTEDPECVNAEIPRNLGKALL